MRHPVLFGRLFSDYPPPLCRNPVHSAVLSALFPGLGQAYNCQIVRGLVFAIVFILFLPLILPAVFLWCVAVWDAYTYAKKINEKPQPVSE